MIKKFLGIDFVDVLIQFGVTFGVAVLVSAGSHGNDEMPVAFVMTASLVVLAWRRNRALKQRGSEHLTTGEVESERLAYLEDRVAELEANHNRVLELEERLDFTERMLAQQRDGARIGPGQ